jgi:hypothetical protein
MLGSTFRHCRWWGASIAAILAASLSPLGYSQGNSQAVPKPVTPSSAHGRRREFRQLAWED